jgi:hypothetical protein
MRGAGRRARNEPTMGLTAAETVVQARRRRARVDMSMRLLPTNRTNQTHSKDGPG